MLIKNLKKIVDDGRERGLSNQYIKTELKEELIYYALDFIYNSPKWNKLIFNGGTALKVIGKTSRLSEDLDLDYLEGSFDTRKFLDEFLNYFKQLGIENIKFSIKQNNKNITLKFPILKKLDLIKNIKSESNLLFLKIEIEKNKYSAYNINKTPISRNNLFMVIRHYSLESLFANKIGAILGRKNKIFHNKYDFKGRDFYDLIWFLQNNIKPDLSRIKQIIKAEHNKNINKHEDVYELITKRIEKINTKGIYDDMKNLVEKSESIKQLSKNYLEIYKSLISSIIK